MIDFDDWPGYVAQTTNRPPRPLYQAAVNLVSPPGQALDLGCGAGNETLDLLRRGWRVHAVDSSGAALDEVHRRATGLSGLTTACEPLWTADLPAAELAYAGFSIFFCPVEQFAASWSRVAAAVRAGGLFAGHFLGSRDDWSGHPAISTHTGEELRRLFADWELILLDEVELDGQAMRGPKHWHRYDVVARRV